MKAMYELSRYSHIPKPHTKHSPSFHENITKSATFSIIKLYTKCNLSIQQTYCTKKKHAFYIINQPTIKNDRRSVVTKAHTY